MYTKILRSVMVIVIPRINDALYLALMRQCSINSVSLKGLLFLFPTPSCFKTWITEVHFCSRSKWQRLSRHRWSQSNCQTSPHPPPCQMTSAWTNILPTSCWWERARWVQYEQRDVVGRLGPTLQKRKKYISLKCWKIWSTNVQYWHTYALIPKTTHFLWGQSKRVCAKIKCFFK